MKNILVLCLSLLVVNTTYAEVGDANQTIYGQNSKSPYENNEEVEKSPFVDSINEMESMQSDTGINHVGSGSEEWLDKSYENEDLKTFTGKQGSLTKIDDRMIAKALMRKSQSALMFSYIYDTFDYFSVNNTYANTFQNEDSASAFQMGYLSLGYRTRFWGERFRIFGQFNGSVSFNKGKGSFQDGSLSNATIKLWHLPMSYHMGARFYLGRYVGVSASAGPLISALLQNRSDRGDGASDKDIRQAGFGFSGQVNIDFSMTQFFPTYGVKLKNESDIYDMNVSLIIRTMNVSNFKNEDVEISGTSFGIGVNFEYL